MRKSNQVSDHISYAEATKSRTAIKYGIDNTPDTLTLSNMKYVANNIFEPVRGRFCVPIAVTSFYRSEELNKKVGGSSTSQHVKGEAMDIDADVYGMVNNKEIFDYIKDNLEFDQLIWEYGNDKQPDWIHVSLTNGRNRRQVLVAYKENKWGISRTKYKNYED